MTFGFYWCVWVRKANTVSEFTLSYRAANTLFPNVPKAAFSNVEKPKSLSILWNQVKDEKDGKNEKAHPWMMKLSALLATPFERTIFLDNDVYLLRLRNQPLET
jgi:hypothetical protein